MSQGNGGRAAGRAVSRAPEAASEASGMDLAVQRVRQVCRQAGAKASTKHLRSHGWAWVRVPEEDVRTLALSDGHLLQLVGPVPNEAARGGFAPDGVVIMMASVTGDRDSVDDLVTPALARTAEDRGGQLLTREDGSAGLAMELDGRHVVMPLEVVTYPVEVDVGGEGTFVVVASSTNGEVVDTDSGEVLTTGIVPESV